MNKSTKPKKGLGQHWLSDEEVLNHICDVATVKDGDTVLEIGPGKGTLTQQLLEKGAHVVAVEIDEQLYCELIKTMPSPHLTLVNEDIMQFDFKMLPADYKVVANIPYYLTSHLIRVLSETENSPASITLLIQKEVAERITAKPGDMSILSVSAQFYYDVKLGDVVPSNLFTPAPQVDSQVVHMSKKSTTNYERVDTRLLFRVVKAGFSSKRKTLLNSLSGGLHMPKESTQKLLEEVDIKPSTRPQELSIADWIKIQELVNKLSI